MQGSEGAGNVGVKLLFSVQVSGSRPAIGITKFSPSHTYD